MPSQRLLKMLDPRGHMAPRAVASRPTVVCFTSKPLRDWAAGEITAAGMSPLVATSFNHVRTSLHAAAEVPVGVAILDFDVLGAGDISQLITLRWTGYRGQVIALSRSGAIDARTEQLASVAAIVKPTGPALRELLLVSARAR